MASADYLWEIIFHYDDGSERPHSYMALTKYMAQSIAKGEMERDPKIKRSSFKRRRWKR